MIEMHQPARAHRDLERRGHQQVERGNVGEARAQAEHAAEEADAGEGGEAGERAVRAPVDRSSAPRGSWYSPCSRSDRAERVRLGGRRWPASIACARSGRAIADHGGAERDLHHVGGQREADAARRRSRRSSRPARAASPGAGWRAGCAAAAARRRACRRARAAGPAPRTKSRWNGKKLPTIGTNSTPPPMPASTATMPSSEAQREQRERPDPPGRGQRGIHPLGRLCSHYAEARRQRLDAVRRGRISSSASRAAARAGFRAVEYQYPVRVASRRTSRRRRARRGVEVVLHNMPPRRSRSAASAAPPACPGASSAFARISSARSSTRARRAARSLHLMAGVVPAGADRAALHATYVVEPASTPAQRLRARACGC